MSFKNEKWLPVVGYEGLYEISNYGRIYSVPNNNKVGGILKDHIDKKTGYHFIILSKNNKTFNTGIHRLVAQAFIPNPENKPTVNHIDGNKSNNNINNLEWATHKEQLIHSFKLGLRDKQCNIERKCVLIYPNNKFIKFETIDSLNKFLGKSKSFCANKIRKYGNIFYVKDKMISISDYHEDYLIVKYKKPTLHDVNLYEYCELNNLNYSTVRARKRRGLSEQEMLKPTKTNFVKYKGGDANEF